MAETKGLRDRGWGIAVVVLLRVFHCFEDVVVALSMLLMSLALLSSFIKLNPRALLYMRARC